MRIHSAVCSGFVHSSVFTPDFNTIHFKALISTPRAEYGPLCHLSAGGGSMTCSHTRQHFPLLGASSSGALGVGRSKDREDVSPVNWERRPVLLTWPQQLVSLLASGFALHTRVTPPALSCTLAFDHLSSCLPSVQHPLMPPAPTLCF